MRCWSGIARRCGGWSICGWIGPCRARVDASDIVQDVLVEANRRLKEYLNNPAMPFHLWLRHMARDRLIDAHRRHRVSQRRSLDREQPLVAAPGPRSFHAGAGGTTLRQRADAGRRRHVARAAAAVSAGRRGAGRAGPRSRADAALRGAVEPGSGPGAEPLGCRRQHALPAGHAPAPRTAERAGPKRRNRDRRWRLNDNGRRRAAGRTAGALDAMPCAAASRRTLSRLAAGASAPGDGAARAVGCGAAGRASRLRRALARRAGRRAAATNDCRADAAESLSRGRWATTTCSRSSAAAAWASSTRPGSGA